VEDEALTVADLIAELQKMPQDAKVYTEGCDCDGDAASVAWENRLQAVMIGRSRRVA
jgi:hypothetical protein